MGPQRFRHNLVTEQHNDDNTSASVCPHSTSYAQYWCAGLLCAHHTSSKLRENKENEQRETSCCDSGLGKKWRSLALKPLKFQKEGSKRLSPEPRVKWEAVWGMRWKEKSFSNNENCINIVLQAVFIFHSLFFSPKQVLLRLLCAQRRKTLISITRKRKS